MKAIVGLAIASMVLIGMVCPVYAEGTASSGPWRTRCGWFDNPSPGNATLTDHQGEWTVAMQGASSAEGEWPTFQRAQWIRTGTGSAGYGCACLKVREDAQSRTITHIIEARAKALSVCRRDKALTEPVNALQSALRPPWGAPGSVLGSPSSKGHACPFEG